MAVHVAGLVMMVIFYALVLGLGIWGSVKSKKMKKNAVGGQLEVSLLADRGVPMTIGVFTMSATWVGGSFIIGISEAVYEPTKGLLWALVPLQISISFLLGGLFFAKPMRDKQYISMMEPFQRKYGKVLSGFLSIIPLMTELVWVPSTLISLGGTMSVVLDLSVTVCVWISAAVAIMYTVLGGLYSVAFTDVIQMLFVLVGLWLCVPFILTSGVYTDITKTASDHVYQAPWLGRLEVDQIGGWIDNFLLMSMGNLAIQDFHQRTLSSISTSTARNICFIAAVVVILSGIPSVLAAAVAASTDWNATSYGSPSPYERGQVSMVLPITLQHLAPSFVSAVGIGAVAAAVMSCADSFLLSASTLFTTNIYQAVRSQASDKELQWVIRLSILAVGLVGTSLTVLDDSVMVFWVLGSDLTYTIIFPQFICVLFAEVSNGYGAVVGYVTAVLLRLLCGEPLLGLPVLLHFPGSILEDGVYVQRAPVKTICMIVSLICILTFSYLAALLFDKRVIPERWDVFKVTSQTAAAAAAAAAAASVADKTDATEEPRASEPMLETSF